MSAALIDQQSLHNRVLQLAASVATARRLGTATDQPEGCRYIQISDTLANRITVLMLRAAAELREK